MTQKPECEESKPTRLICQKCGVASIPMPGQATAETKYTCPGCISGSPALNVGHPKRQRPKRFRPELFGMPTIPSPVIGEKLPPDEYKKTGERLRTIMGPLFNKKTDARTRKRLKAEVDKLLAPTSAAFDADKKSWVARTETVDKERHALMDRILTHALATSILTPIEVAVLRSLVAGKSLRKRAQDLGVSKSQVPNLEKQALGKLRRNGQKLVKLLGNDPDTSDEAMEAFGDMLDSGPDPKLSQQELGELRDVQRGRSEDEKGELTGFPK